MSTFDALLDLDSNGRPIYTDLPFRSKKTITFAGATTNGIGDIDGTNNPFTIFTVTGVVEVKLLAVVTTNLAEAAGAPTLEVGIAGTTNLFIATTTASLIDAGEIWHDNSPDAATELESVLAKRLLANSQDIIGTVGNTNNINTGVIDFYISWKPISSDGMVTPA